MDAFGEAEELTWGCLEEALGADDVDGFTASAGPGAFVPLAGKEEVFPSVLWLYAGEEFGDFVFGFAAFEARGVYFAWVHVSFFAKFGDSDRAW